MITTLGEALLPTPLSYSIDDRLKIPASIKFIPGEKRDGDLMFELAGPRSHLFFDPATTKVGIVTCGGLCPGLNNVIRSLFLELYFIYGVKEVTGFRYGYKGLDPANEIEPIQLTPNRIKNIHQQGGTILGTSRGPVNITAAVDNLIKLGINILFTIGGDGTQKGGFELFKEAQRKDYPLAVVGIPKTIDNDVPFVTRTFGYLTAVEESCKVIGNAHVEASSVENGISIVKLMGRNAGFIAVGATVANQDVNFVLIPEVPFSLYGETGFLSSLKKRILDRRHAVIVVAEGAGQDLLSLGEKEHD
ncbi:MAG TPA: ATP-dependent 6-phosphofructokinase, partial [Bacteroidales bacterium]|nr:ATP-dependent 6-phosphofructokinase [Bacteroidales bacterium]